MADQPIQIRCPGCGCLKAVPMAVGQQLQCHVCRTVFFAPVASPDELPQNDPWQDETGAESPGALEGTTEPAPQDGPSQATETLQGNEPLGDDEQLVFQQQQGKPARHAGSAPAGTGWPSQAEQQPGGSTPASEPSERGHRPAQPEPPADQPARPDWPADEPEPVGPAGPLPGAPSRLRRQPSGRVPGGRTTIGVWLLPLATTILLAGAVLLTLMLLRWGTGAVSDERPFAAPVTEGPTVREAVEPNWSDASRFAQRLGAISVRVEGVKHGPLRVRDRQNRTITTEDDNLLAVRLTIENHSRQGRDFTSWYGNAFASDGGEQVAELTDDAQRAYGLLRFEDVSRVEGQRYSDQIEPGQTARDTVVFIVPEGVELDTIQFLRLKLPGAAVGANGVYHFQIPADMVERSAPQEPESAPAEEEEDQSAQAAGGEESPD